MTKITPGGLAEATGRFAVGDEVVKINEVRRCSARAPPPPVADRAPARAGRPRRPQSSIRGWNTDKVMGLLRSLAPGPVTFTVVRQSPP